MKPVSWPAIIAGLCAIFVLCACNRFTPDLTNTPSTITSSYILHCKTVSCGTLQPLLDESGAEVTHYYDNLPLLALQISPVKHLSLRKKLGANTLYKDKLVSAPQPVQTRHAQYLTTSVSSQPLKQKNINNSFLHLNQTEFSVSQETQATQIVRPLNDEDDDKETSFNLTGTGISTLHDKGFRGQGIVSAVIDSGVANDAELVPFLSRQIIGGENFVPGETEPSATSTLNSEHGTWVAHLIAAQGTLFLPPDSQLAAAIALFRPDSITRQPDNSWAIDMSGMAPESSIYAIKTFPADGAGSPSSRVIAAMDRVLSLKTNFNDGLEPAPISGDGSTDNPFIYDSLDIRVVNLSLGGVTLFAGREMDELLTQLMLDAGIVVVTAAGNEGFAGLTTGAPGTGLGSLNVGAISIGSNEQVFRELQVGPGMGNLFRPFNDIQIAHFSSRGPSADGRPSIHLLANGVATFVQGADGHLSMVSGSSFSAPIVAGAAASLISMNPSISAYQVREIFARSANPHLLPTASAIDQGFGILDVDQALKVLRQTLADADDDDYDDDSIFPEQTYAEPGTRINAVLRARGFDIEENNQFSAQAQLQPGQVRHLWLEIPPDTAAVTISIDGLFPDLPTEMQNALFGDDMIIEVLDGPTSTDHLRLRAFVNQSEIFTILDPVPGLMRIALMGDWTNIGNVSTELGVEVTAGEPVVPNFQASIGGQEAHVFEFEVANATTDVTLNLEWPNSWAWYPAHDLDMVLISPSDLLNLDGATFHAPEHIHLIDPEPGIWNIIVEGFSLHGDREVYSLAAENTGINPVDAPTNMLIP